MYVKWPVFFVAILVGCGGLPGVDRAGCLAAEPGSAGISMRSPTVADALASSGIACLDDPSLYRIPAETEPDPLGDVAEEIRLQIDPTLEKDWTERKSEDFVELMREIHADYEQFWTHIPAGARRFVDLDNDGVEELVVVSDRLNRYAWGFCHFIAVLKQVQDPDGSDATAWRLLHLEVLDAVWISREAEPEEQGRARWMEHELVVVDLDRDGRPDVLITSATLGASASSHCLRVLSMHPDMRIRSHTLESREPFDVIGPGLLRPAFIQHHDDEWAADDVGAAVRARGYRKAYYRWTVQDGWERW